MAELDLPQDYVDLLHELDQAGADYVLVIGREALLQNKRASARPKDLADVAALERHDRR